MSYNPEDDHLPEENSESEWHIGASDIDITSFMEPTGETTVQFETVQAELLKSTFGEQGRSVTHRYNAEPDADDCIRVTFNQATNFDAQGNEVEAGEVTLALDFIDRTMTVRAGEDTLTDFEYAVLVDSLNRLGRNLPKTEMEWLRDILVTAQLDKADARLHIPDLMDRSPYPSMEYRYHHLPLQGYANGAFMSGNWTFVSREELEGAPSDTKLSYIDLRTPDGDAYRYSKLKDGGERLSVKTVDEQLSSMFSLGSEGVIDFVDIPRQSRRRNESGVNHLTEATLASLTSGIRQALDSGSLLTSSEG